MWELGKSYFIALDLHVLTRQIGGWRQEFLRDGFRS